MKALNILLKFLESFIPKATLEKWSYSERQKGRMIVIAGFFGLFVPFVLIFSSSTGYPDRYFPTFYFLWGLAFYALTVFKLFRTSLKVTGIICSLGLTFILMAFTLQHTIIFSATVGWFSAAVMIGVFMAGWRWGLVNFGLLLATLFANHYLYETNGIVIPSFWDEGAWIANLKSDQITSLIFNTVMVSLFLFTKEKSDEELITSQEAVRSQQETLFKKSRMAELGEVAGGIAHEINNPMTVIRANAQRIKRDISLDRGDQEKLIQMAGKIEKTCDRISKIIGGLKNYSRDASGDPLERVAMDKLLADVKEIFQEKMHHKMIKFDVKSSLDGVDAKGRYGQIYQVLVNLINNAIDALDEANDDERYIGIACEVIHDDKVRLYVIDSGEGIPKNLQEKIFQPFFTTKPVGKGTGLGLSISHELMQQQGGSLTYTREKGDSRFILEIPLFIEINDQAA